MFSINRFQVATLKVSLNLMNFEGNWMGIPKGSQVNLLEITTALKERFYAVQTPQGLGVLPITLFPNFKLFIKGVSHA